VAIKGGDKMVVELSEEQAQTNEQTRKIFDFLSAEAKDVSILWRMHIISTEKSKIIPLAKSVVVCYNREEPIELTEKRVNPNETET